MLVEGEELGEQILFGTEAVGGEDGGVERGVGVLQRIRAGQFEGAIERAQSALQFRQRLGAHAAQLARRRRHGVNFRNGVAGQRGVFGRSPVRGGIFVASGR